MKLFNGEEIRDVTLSILVLILIFSFSRINDILIVSLIVIFSFVLRLVSQKVVARKLGCMVTYKSWFTGILIGIIGMFFFWFTKIPLAIAIPGFVEIMPFAFGRWGFKVVRITTKDLGLISLAGVGINVLLAVIFKALPGFVFQQMSFINGVIAIFNLLPIPNLDGSRIFLWKMWFWLFLVFVNVLVLIL